MSSHLCSTSISAHSSAICPSEEPLSMRSHGSLRLQESSRRAVGFLLCVNIYHAEVRRSCAMCVCLLCCMLSVEELSTMKLCVITFSPPHSPPSDPGLPRDAGPGAWRVCQPPLPRRRHPEPQLGVAEERSGAAATILQTALPHR